MRDLYTGDLEKKYLVYSKTVSDNLPITTTFVGPRPCKDPGLTSSSAEFYYTENDARETCIDEYGQYLLDTNYKLISELGSKFEL